MGQRCDRASEPAINTKPKPEPMLTYHQGCSVAFNHLRTVSQTLMGLTRNICAGDRI